jgi:glycosyltransferase involved in cell wall biosynthesis
VAAVLGQTWREFELIVVDDGSTDGTPEWLEGIADPRVRVLRQPHRGLPAALNAGFQAARGDCLTWTSADNLPHPAMLERLLAALEARPEAGMVVAGHLLIDARDRILRVHRDQDATPLSLVGANPGIAAFLYRRGLAAVRAGYDPELDGAEDWDLWLRIAEEAPIAVLPEILYSYRLHPDSMTATRGERIAAASRGVVARALARHGGTLPPEVYLPGRAVPAAPPPELGRAYWDLARRMHRSPFAPKDLALRLFREAAARLRDPDLCHGMFLAALRAWDPAAIAGSLQDLALAGDPARAGRLTAGVRAGRLEEADLVLPEPLHHPGA